MKNFSVFIICLFLSGCVVISKKQFNKVLDGQYQAGVGEGFIQATRGLDEEECKASMQVMDSSELAMLYEAKEDLIVMAMLYSDLCESKEQKEVIEQEIEYLRKQQVDIIAEFFNRCEREEQ